MAFGIDKNFPNGLTPDIKRSNLHIGSESLSLD
jgi:hypothetical protein